MTETTGQIQFRVGDEVYQTWYKVIGDLKSGIRPLVVLHGGPGFSYDYMLPHVELFQSHQIPIIFYEQIGIGQSTHLPNKPKEFWTIDLFMDELDNVLTHFDISDNFDLLGHSWGGMLAANYASSRPSPGLKHLVIANSGASMVLWERGARELFVGLPEDMRETLLKHEKEGTTDSDEYQHAAQVFYQKHICKLNPWPELVLKSIGAMSDDPTVYHTTLGPSDFYVNGTFRSWSCIDQLHKITSPTLLINSPEDEATDLCNLPFFLNIPKVKWVQFVESTHLPFYEEKERYFKVLGEFLTTV